MSKSRIMSVDTDVLKFIDSPPEYMHLKCPVCFNLLLDPPPELVDCCGNHFCSACIESLKGCPCPLCKKNFRHMQDRNHSRAIKALKVYCTNQPSCTWEGDLEGLVHHLSKEGDCQYVQLPCKYQCGASPKRSELVQHEGEKCPRRPFVCQYCHEYSSTLHFITTIHYNTCSQVPVECPNNCGDIMVRGAVDKHRSTSCPLQVIECEMCSWKGQRKDLNEHMEQEWKEHVMLALSSHTKSIEKLSARLEQRDSKIHNLHQEIIELKLRFDKLEREQVPKPLREYEPPKLTSKFDIYNDDDDNSISEDDTCPFYRKITRVSECMRYNNMITSRPFYYGPAPGYMMIACIYLNGFDEGRGTHVSVYIRLCPNKHDFKLKWPFSGKVTIRLRDQLTHANHHEREIDFNEAPIDCRKKPNVYENRQYGISKFIAHSLLQPHYLVQDEMVLEIPEIKIQKHAHNY